jgi:DNA gyrase/topoisomerase IV subunit B
VSGGLHGVGVSVVNALSQKLTATVRRDRQAHALTFVRGKTASSLEVTAFAAAATSGGGVPWLAERGTEISFRPDPEIFKPSGPSLGDDDEEASAAKTRADVMPAAALAGMAVAPLTGVFEHSRLASRMDELAYLHANLTLTLVEARTGMVIEAHPPRTSLHQASTQAITDSRR